MEKQFRKLMVVTSISLRLIGVLQVTALLFGITVVAQKAETVRLAAVSNHSNGRENALDCALPDGFWSMAAAESMCAFLDQNRSQAHRDRFNLRIELDEEPGLPEFERLSLHEKPSQSYATGSRSYFFSNQPGDRYFAFGSVHAPHCADPYDTVYSPPTFKFKFVAVEDSLARSVAQRISSLNYIEEEYRRDINLHGKRRSGVTWSSADGFGRLSYWTALSDQPSVTWEGSVWSLSGADFSDRFSYKINEEIRLNFAHYLLTVEFVRTEDFGFGQNSAEMRSAVLKILQRFSVGQREVTYSLVQIAAEAAGEWAYAEAEPSLRKIARDLKPPQATTEILVKRERFLQREVRQLTSELQRWGITYGHENSQNPDLQILLDQRAAYRSQRAAITIAEAERERFALQNFIESALKRIKAAEDVETLRLWAVSEDEAAAGWALRHLSRAKPEVYTQLAEKHFGAVSVRQLQE